MPQQGHSKLRVCLQTPFISVVFITLALVWFIEEFLLGMCLTFNCLGSHIVNIWRQQSCRRDEPVNNGAEMMYVLNDIYFVS